MRGNPSGCHRCGQPLPVAEERERVCAPCRNGESRIVTRRMRAIRLLFEEQTYRSPEEEEALTPRGIAEREPAAFEVL